MQSEEPTPPQQPVPGRINGGPYGRAWGLPVPPTACPACSGTGASGLTVYVLGRACGRLPCPACKGTGRE